MPETESTTMTPSMNAMLTALSADRGASVTELSKRAGLGRSTAARVLTTLEGMGVARRERPDRSADHSSPDLWFTVATSQGEPDAPGEQSADRAAETEPDTHASDLPAQTDVDDPQAAPNSEAEGAAEDEHAQEGKGGDEPTPQLDDGEPDARSDGEAPTAQQDPEPVADPAPATGGAATDPEPGQEPRAESARSDAADPDAAAPSRTGAKERLGKGELRVMVFEHLKAHPDEDFTASQVGKALNKSSGAVSNNFDALAKTGDAQMTCEKPRRFRFLAKAAS